jgi:L-lactate dehydrogenase (cytochrome)
MTAMDTVQQREAGSAGSVGASPVRAAIREPRRAAGLRRYLCLDDFDRSAQRFLPRMLHGFIAGGAETEASLRANRASFAAYRLLPRMLVDTSARSQATTLFGRRYAAPFGIAPMGMSALLAYRGDVALARAAVASDIPMVLSASSLIRMEEVRQAGADWYQAYLPGDPARIEPLLERVAAAGFGTLVLTVDIPVPANRENNTRNGFTVPLDPTPRLAWDGITHPAWLLGTAVRTLMRHGMPHFENMDAGRGPPILSRDLVRATGPRDRLTWEHVSLIRRLWRGTLVVKGILAPGDAALAQAAGVDGIIVSNHGGRQLDSAVTPLQMLPAIAAQAGGMVVMLDGGIRRGTDVLKAMALGADFVFVGRPFLFAAVLGGEAMVRHAASVLSQEIDRDMALMGLTGLASLSPEQLRGLGGETPA